MEKIEYQSLIYRLNRVSSPAHCREYRYLVSILYRAVKTIQVPDILAVHVEVDKTPYFALVKNPALKLSTELFDQFIQYTFNGCVSEFQCRFTSMCYIAQCRRKSYFYHLYHLQVCARVTASCCL